MVLFKRKPVRFLPRPQIEDEDVECWIIPETQEVFLSYESYLQRMDWYKARKFICEISGHSGLSFFDALKSETAGARDVENAFPEPLKAPVLRKIQFSTVSRIDNLVDQVYDDFKNDYYPTEHVIVNDEGERKNGIIRDKAKFEEIRDPTTGEVKREAFCRYIIRLDDKDLLVEEVNVSRDRKAFTKQMLRSFIKNHVTREAWTGAPWLVKHSMAEHYGIDTQVPLHLQHGHKVAEKKERKKAEQQDGMFGIWPSNKLPELKPNMKGRKHAPQLSQDQIEQIQRAQWEEYQRAQAMDPQHAQQWGQGSPPAGFPNGYPYPHPHAHFPVPDGHSPAFPPAHMIPKNLPKPPPAAPPPIIKYPIEDMDCPPHRDGVQRPPLKFVALSQTASEDQKDDLIPGLEERNVGLLLETWNTLNVYCQVLYLDSFTFDDFVDAMQWTSTSTDCQLFSEVHCAVLKQLVFGEKDGGAIQIALPDLPEPEGSDEEEELEESRITPTPEPDVPARRTRSSLNKMALAEAEEEKRAASEASEAIPHRAAEMFSEEYGWIDRLRKRDFRSGGWQLIIVGLLHQLAGRPRLTESCERILKRLAPLDAEPTMETVIEQYSKMDINLRIEVLQILCQLWLETRAVKKFLEEMAATMTQYRKQKIDHQRARKEAMAELKRLVDERKILAPQQEKSPTPVEELEELQDAEKLAVAEETMVTERSEIADSEVEEEVRPITTRSLRRGQDRAAERKRKREEEQARLEKKAAEDKEKAKYSKEYQKILKGIEAERKKILDHEEQIDILDADLREADAYRTRCLGKDRFCNRYWWFERNAMPFGGLPDSSTADAEYANGRLWVQGPDDMERVGYIDVPDEPRNNYFRSFHMTPAERKILEEGPTNLHFAQQWGFYEDVEDVDRLIEWLDSRGVRELKLKKELTIQRDIIAKYMGNRVKYVHPERRKTKASNGGENGADVEHGADEETEDEKVVAATTRMSTRTKTLAAGIEDLEKVHRCLRWKNTAAVHEFGHRHADSPPAPTGKKGKTTAASRKAAALAEVAASAPTTRGTRASAAGRKSEEPIVLNRQGKPTTRQGSRYHF